MDRASERGATAAETRRMVDDGDVWRVTFCEPAPRLPRCHKRSSYFASGGPDDEAS